MRHFFFGLALLGLLGTACGGGGVGTKTTSSPSISSSPSPSESPLPPNTVLVSNDAFSPSNLGVAVGTTVTWSNKIGTNPHNVVSSDKLFNSNPKCTGTDTPCLKVGEVFRYTFAKSGTFRYYCYVHGFCDQRGCGGMSGVINVT